MGDIKKQRKKYQPPFKKWDKTRADEEDALVAEFGLANKKEVWKANRAISKLRDMARSLFTKTGPVAEKTKKEIIAKAHRMGLLSVESATLDDILGLTTRDILGRRLQTMIMKQGLANTPMQARQFISHGHIVVGGRKVTVPGYIVKKEEEAVVGILPRSPVADPNHPARMTPQKKEEARLLELLRKKKEKEAAAAAAAPPAAEEIPPVIEEEDIKKVAEGGEEA